MLSSSYLKETFGLSSNFFYNLKEPLVLFQGFVFEFDRISNLVPDLTLCISKLCFSIFQKKIISRFISKPNPILPTYQ